MWKTERWLSMWTCYTKALTFTLSDIMINCNRFNDWDYSLLVFNKVFDSHITFWTSCYFSIRNYMTIYVVVLKMIMMPSCTYFILSTPLSLNMWTYFRYRLLLEDKRGLSLGELIRPFCIMLLYWYLLHYGLLLQIIAHYLCLFSLILQDLHEEGECR